MEKTVNFLNNQRYVMSDYKKSLIVYSDRITANQINLLVLILLAPVFSLITFGSEIKLTFLFCFLFLSFLLYVLLYFSWKIHNYMLKVLRQGEVIVLYVCILDKSYLLEQSVWHMWSFKRLCTYAVANVSYIFLFYSSTFSIYDHYFAYWKMYNYILKEMGDFIAYMYIISFFLWLLITYTATKAWVLLMESSEEVGIEKKIITIYNWEQTHNN